MTSRPKQVWKSTWPIVGIAAVIVLGYVAFGLWILWAWATIPEADRSLGRYAQFGDAFGAFNALASTLALVAVVVSLLYQRSDQKTSSSALKTQQRWAILTACTSSLRSEIEELKNREYTFVVCGNLTSSKKPTLANLLWSLKEGVLEEECVAGELANDLQGDPLRLYRPAVTLMAFLLNYIGTLDVDTELERDAMLLTLKAAVPDDVSLAILSCVVTSPVSPVAKNMLLRLLEDDQKGVRLLQLLRDAATASRAHQSSGGDTRSLYDIEPGT